MCSQELRRRLHIVDPKLNIVSGGIRRHSGDGRDNWARAAGVICRNCLKEVYRSRDGLCMSCWEQAHEIEVRDGTGITNWLPMDIIKQITHPAKREQP